MGTAICFLVNMTGRFLIGVVLVLVLGLGLTSSHVIDDISKDLIDKFDEVKASLVDNKQLQADTYVSDGLVKLILKIYNSPEVKGKCEKEAKAKREEWKQKQKNLIPGRSSKLDYQALIHLKKSFAADGTWLEAMESEACSVCVLNKLCDDTDDILKRFKFDSSFSKRKQRRLCKVILLALAPRLFPPEDGEAVVCDTQAPYRTFDGRCNNLVTDRLFGSTGGEFRRLETPDYGDCVSALRTDENGDELPNARNVSRFVHDGNEERKTPESSTLTHLAMNFAQFLDHDVTLAEAQGLDCEPYNAKLNPECINIEVPDDDSSFRNRSVREFELERDAPHREPKGCKLIVRQHSNTITAYIDGSNVYGSSDEEAADLRDRNGLLRTMKPPHGCPMKRLLPAQDPDLFCESRDPLRPCFVAGDERANENPGLISVHTIFVREHNRIAKEFNRITSWDAERIFQETRRIIGAVLQRIVYNEFLPLILSKKMILDNDLNLLSGKKTSKDYDPTLNAQMSSAFSVAAYRFGHSMIRDTFSRIPQVIFEQKCDKEKPFLPIPTLDFGNPQYVYDKCQGALDSIYRGLVDDPSSKVDGKFAAAVQNNLSRGKCDLADLIAINIERSRERGVGGYTRYRNGFCKMGRKKVKEFDDLKKDGFTTEAIKNLKMVYKHVDDIDLFTGLHLEGSNPDDLEKYVKCAEEKKENVHADSTE
ncbi:hypothetical protein OS493_009495 [Desmophyllum pertusum]|uniref:Peroxidase n=1 Tax=Desmophyllum pertusum TaxID=174260 RepID=A0A9W9Z395_9CNID|nr:hypothetical protein OS493_009495 [Desmophyllum pertusum]